MESYEHKEIELIFAYKINPSSLLEFLDGDFTKRCICFFLIGSGEFFNVEKMQTEDQCDVEDHFEPPKLDN